MEEAIKMIIPAVVGLLGALTAYLKTKAERKNTAEQREQQFKDMEQTNHDELQKMKWDMGKLKDDIVFHHTVLEDLRSSVNIMNTNIVKLQTTIELLLTKKD